MNDGGVERRSDMIVDMAGIFIKTRKDRRLFSLFLMPRAPIGFVSRLGMEKLGDL